MIAGGVESMTRAPFVLASVTVSSSASTASARDALDQLDAADLLGRTSEAGAAVQANPGGDRGPQGGVRQGHAEPPVAGFDGKGCANGGLVGQPLLHARILDAHLAARAVEDGAGEQRAPLVHGRRLRWRAKARPNLPARHILSLARPAG